ncbi:MAG: hypothetical protein AAF151_21920 [Cyanobacteria bacterium J06656_5]
MKSLTALEHNSYVRHKRLAVSRLLWSTDLKVTIPEAKNVPNCVGGVHHA